MIAIYYIATSNYKQGFVHFKRDLAALWRGVEKRVIVLSDGLEEWDGIKEEEITYEVRHIEHYPWPIITLFKMRHILTNKVDCDYVIYMNGNMQYNNRCNLPLPSKLVCSRHIFSEGDNFDGDKFATIDHRSAAYINEPYHYVHGGLFYGPADIVYKMCKDVTAMVEKDLLCNIIPQWHDESYLNKWCVENKHLVEDKKWLISYQCFKDDKPFAVIETIEKDRRKKKEPPKVLTIGGLGNTLFSICNAIKDTNPLVVLCNDKARCEEFKPIMHTLFGDTVKVEYEDYPITDEIQSACHGNPHDLRNRITLSNGALACFGQVMPDIDLIYTVRERLINIIPSLDKVVIHVRRGDFMSAENSACHPTMSADFYQRAMNEFPNEEFLVVSDDIDWCKKHIKGDSISYADGTTSQEDFVSLLGAKGIIYGNSTFGYFGALMNPRKKKVVCCKNWYRVAYNKWNMCYDKLFRDNYPDELVLLDYLYT